MTLSDLDNLIRRKLKFYSEPLSNGCHVWVGAKNKAGYGEIVVYVLGKKTLQLAHRISFMLANSLSINRFQVVRHTCDNPACVNPEHLVLGTQKENLKDMREKNRSLVGERNHQAKLKDFQISEIRSLYSSGKYSQRDLAKQFDVHQTTIGDAINNKCWKHVNAKVSTPSSVDTVKTSSNTKSTMVL
jgi:hypothetical protein